jgi:Xaa-Pro dipeptidase
MLIGASILKTIKASDIRSAMPINLERAKRLMQKAGVEAIIAASPANVFYVSDYFGTGMQLGSGTQGYVLLPLEGEPALIAPLTEADLVIESNSWIKDLYWYGCLKVNSSKNPEASEVTKSLEAAVNAESKDTPCDSLVVSVTNRGLAKKTLAIDSVGVNQMRWETIKKNLPDAKIINGSKLLSEIRAVKIPEEITLIQRATEITEKSMEDALEIAQPGIMELDMGQMYNYSVAEDGGKVTYDHIGFGERSAYPNPTPTTQQLEKGALIRLNLGATWNHYHGNVTRTAAIGKTTALTEKRLKAVIDAQEAVFDLIKPDSKIRDLYKAAQVELEKAGLKECSMNLGHCIGTECNEQPWISPNSEATLEEGMVLNVDIPFLDLGWGGIELEDTLLVTKKDPKLLTNTERTLYLL